jgi:hypothetical protein
VDSETEASEATIVAKTKGPGPVDPAQSGRVLDLRAKLEQLKEAKAQKVIEKAGGNVVEGEAGEPKPMDVHEDGFQPRSSGIFFEQAPEVVGRAEVDRGGNLKARLTALGVKGAGLIKSQQTDRARSTDTPLGKVLDGAVHADTAAGLQQLLGVVKAREIGLQESRIKSADLLVLQSLIEADRFTIEGSPTLLHTDALSSLERGGSVYIGFNAVLQRILLNLKHTSVFIVESNPMLRELILPKFERATKYVVIEDNPLLQRVQIGTRERPAHIEKLEIRGNARDSYPDIFLA